VSDDKIGAIIEEGECLSIDWSLDNTYLTYPRPESKNWFVEDPSLKENNEAQDLPISLDQCMAWFNQEENMGDELFCSTCDTNQKATKKMDLWKLPPVLIIHLKRFQFYNNKWRKSNRVVEFPISGLDPLMWLPKSKRKAEKKNQITSTTSMVSLTILVILVVVIILHMVSGTNPGNYSTTAE